MRRFLPISALFLAPLWLLGQAGEGPKFEVVSVKASEMTGSFRVGLSTYPGGRVRADHCPLDYLITEAFDIQQFQLSGGPRWLREDRFDIDAKPPASSQSSHSNPNNPKLPPNDEQRGMLQAVLTDRFQLKFHWETKEGPIYSLMRTDKELKLQPPKDKDEYPWAGAVDHGGPFADGIAGINCSMPQLANRLSQAMRRIVVDRTGLEGSFDFKSPYASPDSDTDVVATIMGAIQGLGLKLEAGRGPVRTLVIDSVERPSAN